MRILDLDYAVTAKPYPIWVRFGLLLLGILAAVILGLYYQSLDATLASYQIEASAQDSQSQQQPVMQSADFDLGEAVMFAKQTQQSLNYPWLELLSHLAEIKQAHEDIAFLNVEPNKARSEMRVEGEAKSFNDITNLLNALKADAEFKDAILVNQYLVEPESIDENNGQPLYTFNLLLKWWPS